MAKEFKFPDIGEGITEGEIVRWLVKKGDTVKEDQTLAEIETDKAVVEMPSPFSGTVLRLHFSEKDIIHVGDVLVTIGEKGEKTVSDPGKIKKPEVGEAPKKEEPEEKPKDAGGVVGEIKVSGEEIRDILATPRVRKLALKKKMDIKAIRGTGPDERITEEDVEKAAGSDGGIEESSRPSQKQPRIKSKYDFFGTLDRIPLRGIRRATARRMRKSVDTAAHVTHFDEADVTELVHLREEIKGRAAEKDIRLTYLPFIIKAVIAALKKHPILNSTLDDEEEEIIVKHYYNIGIAVDVPDGLMVPVIKLAEFKTLFELAEEIQSLAQATKDRKLDMADMKGGTFTITNVGIIGGLFATPIINYPEAAILATLRIEDRIKPSGNSFTLRKILPLSLSFDHRIIDGAEAARFTNDLIEELENPGRLLIEDPIP
jgi:pyruvate dehydrogenase E2 component (dihydrolipoamide acetyltransferase)